MQNLIKHPSFWILLVIVYPFVAGLSGLFPISANISTHIAVIACVILFFSILGWGPYTEKTHPAFKRYLLGILMLIIGLVVLMSKQPSHIKKLIWASSNLLFILSTVRDTYLNGLEHKIKQSWLLFSFASISSFGIGFLMSSIIDLDLSSPSAIGLLVGLPLLVLFSLVVSYTAGAFKANEQYKKFIITSGLLFLAGFLLYL